MFLMMTATASLFGSLKWLSRVMYSNRMGVVVASRRIDAIVAYAYSRAIFDVD